MGNYELANEIIDRAIADYRNLKRLHKEKAGSWKRGGEYSINELEDFFHSDWCNFLLKHMGKNFTGAELLVHLRAEFAEN